MTFQFVRNGQAYRVHTEVGNGLCRVIVEPVEKKPEQPKTEEM